MTSSSRPKMTGSGSEPSMFAQRPSAGKCQDISHILTRIFRDEYAKDAIDQDTVRNLTTSKSGRSGYHSQYVEKLQEIQIQWEERAEGAKLVENHLKEAHSLARRNEMSQEEKASEECSSYKQLGLPSVKSHLGEHLDSELLRQFDLIVPHDFIKEEREVHYPVDSGGTPNYARPTTSAMQRYRRTPVEDNYHFEDQDEDLRDLKSSTKHEVNILKIDHQAKNTAATTTKKASGQRVSLDSSNDEKNIWRDLMKPSQRQIERSDLAKLQQKADFLKNPRFAPPKSTKKGAVIADDAVTSNAEETKRSDASEVFQSKPYPVIFTDYEVGKTYEINLTLKNITSSSRQLRVLPPTSSYFSISHGKFPTSDGSVAPGMVCQYCITFSPDSLADYDDVLKVETQFVDPMFIPLQARRPPPHLSLFELFNCGHCLVDGTKTVAFPCVNVGGEGRFYIIPRDKWLAAAEEVAVGSENQVEVGPFVIQPNAFHLKPNEKLEILIKFSPKAVKRCKETVVFACDNCNTKEFSIEGFGEAASVEFVSVEGGLSSYGLHENRDSCAGYLTRFLEQIPGTVRTKQLKIKNITSVELEYDWMIDRPVHNNARDIALSNASPGTLKMSSAVAIAPSTGKLAPLDVCTFNIEFKPTELMEYHNVGRLFLRNVPCPSSQGSIELSDLVTIQIELKGYTKPLDVRTYPEVLAINGCIDIKQPHEFSFKVKNHSQSNCSVNWENIEDDECSLQVEPMNAAMGSMSEVQCYVICVGKKPGFVRRTIVGVMPYSSAPIYCHFEANFVGPTIRFVDSVVNFGLVRHKESQTRLTELKNFSHIEACWNLSENHSDMFEIEPLSGRMESMGAQVMMVKLNAAHPCILNEVIEIEYESGEKCFLETCAVIERPELRFVSSTLDVDECFLDIPIVKKVTLQNLTLFTVQYKWLKVIGKDAEICDVNFRTEGGELKPREELELELKLCAKKQVHIDDLIAVCHVDGMLEPLLLSITAQVSGLKVDLSTPDVRGEDNNPAPNKELKLEFGYDVPMTSNPRTVLVIENKSAIATMFSITVEHFCAARQPTPPDKAKPGSNSDRYRGKALLTRTSSNGKTQGSECKKAAKDFCAAVLSDRKGAAFVPSPAQGKLGPFEQIVVEVTAYMDMWGEYSDVLSCMIDGLNTVRVPIHLECIGCPLNFQISKDPQPILRFGPHISGGEVCSRSLRINNTSPCDIRIDWQSYINENDDTQLLDLLVMIGNPFPLRDHNFDEIASDEDITEPLIQVKLNPHEGIRSFSPFHMEPMQMIVPAKGYTQAIAKFTPLQNRRKTVQVQGYALGYMSLSHKDKFHDEGKSLRCDGIDVNPFSLSITGSIKPARLMVEPESENGFEFVTLASNLLRFDGESGNCSLMEEDLINRRFVISNDYGAVIQCRINLQNPFVLKSVEGKELSDQDDPLHHDLTIKQGSNLEVKVALRLTRSLATGFLNESTDGSINTKSSPQNKMAWQEIVQPMEIAFPNGTNQIYSLKAMIHQPVLSLSADTLNFGTCLIGQERELHVSLRNTGMSACFWSIKMDDDYPESSRAVFKISPLSGFLEENTKHGCRNSDTVKVVFSARQTATYECQITFADILHKSQVTIRLSGTGSHDQSSEQILNILT